MYVVESLTGGGMMYLLNPHIKFVLRINVAIIIQKQLKLKSFIERF